jgi:hypothetical protein
VKKKFATFWAPGMVSVICCLALALVEVVDSRQIIWTRAFSHAQMFQRARTITTIAAITTIVPNKP